MVRCTTNLGCDHVPIVHISNIQQIGYAGFSYFLGADRSSIKRSKSKAASQCKKKAKATENDSVLNNYETKRANN